MSKKKPKFPITDDKFVRNSISKIKKHCVGYIAHLSKILDVCDLEVVNGEMINPGKPVFENHHKAILSSIEEQRRDCKILLRLAEIAGEEHDNKTDKVPVLVDRLVEEFLSYKKRVFDIGDDMQDLFEHMRGIRGDDLDEDDDDSPYGDYDDFDNY